MTRETRSERQFPVRLIVAAIAIAAVAVLVFQNSQTVSFEVLVWDIESRLIWMLLAVAGLGFLAGLVLRDSAAERPPVAAPAVFAKGGAGSARLWVARSGRKRNGRAALSTVPAKRDAHPSIAT